mgnify:CR=1 FL=1
MENSTNKSYQKFLLGIAQQVDSLLIENLASIGRFRQHLQKFADKENKHLKWLNKKREKCFKEGKPFSISSDMKVPSGYKSPACMFVIDYNTKKYPALKNEAEECQRNYITLSSIHDHILTQIEPIDKTILPEQTASLIWSTLHEFWDNGSQRAFIEQALKRVQADLASLKPATTLASDKTGNTTKPQAKAGQGKQGRPKQHSEDKVKAAETLCDELRSEGKSVNECWFEVHKKLGFRSPEAAKQAVYRFKKQNKKQK